MKYLILALLILSACTTTIGPQSEQDFMKGTQGIEFQFVRDRPSKELYEVESFPIVLNIHNKGAHDINLSNQPIVITVNTNPFYSRYISTNNAYITAVAKDKVVIRKLYGKGLFYPLGETQNFVIGSLQTANVPGQIESPETDMTVNICYPYKTVLITETCVSSDIFDTDDRQEACEIKPSTFFEGQGAPITVTKMEPSALLVGEGIQDMPTGPNGELRPTLVQTIAPLFQFEIQNTGGGLPYIVTSRHDSHIDFCSLDNINFETEANKVFFRAFLDPTNNNPNELDCNAGFPDSVNNAVRLLEDKATVFCQLPADNPFINAQYNYLANLRVEIDYVYVSSKTFDFEVLRKPGFVHEGSGITYGGTDSTVVYDPDDFLDRAKDAAEDELGDRADDYLDGLKNKTGILP